MLRISLDIYVYLLKVAHVQHQRLRAGPKKVPNVQPYITFHTLVACLSIDGAVHKWCALQKKGFEEGNGFVRFSFFKRVVGLLNHDDD